MALEDMFMPTLISKVLIIGLCAVAVLSIVDQFFKANFMSFNPPLCALVVLVFYIPFGCCMFVYRKCKPISFFGMTASVVAIAWWIMQFDLGKATNSISFMLTIFALSSAHIALLMAVGCEKLLVKVCKWVAIALSLVTDVAFILGAWNLIKLSGVGKDILYSMLILVALGTVVTPLLHILYKESETTAVSVIEEENVHDAVTEE